MRYMYFCSLLLHEGWSTIWKPVNTNQRWQTLAQTALFYNDTLWQTSLINHSAFSHYLRERPQMLFITDYTVGHSLSYKTKWKFNLCAIDCITVTFSLPEISYACQIIYLMCRYLCRFHYFLTDPNKTFMKYQAVSKDSF